MPDPVVRKLGKLPTKIDSRTLKLSDYIPDAIIYPVEYFRHQRAQPWGAYMNDEMDNCVVAAAGNMIKQWSAYSDRGGIVPTDEGISNTMLDLAANSISTGLANYQSVLRVLNYWRQHGIAGHRIACYLSVNPQNVMELRLATSIFGNVLLGLQLPIIAKTQTRFAITGHGTIAETPGSWGGHCVPIVGYNSDIFMCVSWGKEINMTPEYAFVYADEAYAVITHDWVREYVEHPIFENMLQSVECGMKTATGAGIWPEWKRVG